MLEEAPDYDTLSANFRWRIPERFNMGVAVCDRHAEAGCGIALIEDQGDEVRTWSFDDLRGASNRLANLFRASGLGAGDRIGILLGQRAETLIAHLAAYKLGAIALPLFTLFGPDAVAFRLRDSGARAVVTDQAGAEKIREIRDDLPELKRIWIAGGSGEAGLDRAMERASDAFTPIHTAADDPALLIYTSGTTGNPKGALHGHRTLLGHLPGVQLPNRFFPKPGDRFWTPADWAWIGGLMDVLMASLYFAVPVVASRGTRFDPDGAVRLMAKHQIRNVFFPPTALRLLRQSGARPVAGGARLRSLASGGEKLGDDVIEWGEDAFGLVIEEFYGQTECNVVVSGNSDLFGRRSGSMGRAVPGHEVRVLTHDAAPAAPGERGEIAVRRPDPVMFLGYWNAPDATAAKYRGEWLMTGDLGSIDDDGYLTYRGRADDLIMSAGYRIGPAEIEDCLNRHPAVSQSAVIGAPDALRGEIVKAFVVLRKGMEPGQDLERSIQAFVKDRLAAHEYPRALAFVEDLPLTATGKVRRRDLREREHGRRPDES
jgi:acetyl-CoA synthetase